MEGLATGEQFMGANRKLKFQVTEVCLTCINYK